MSGRYTPQRTHKVCNICGSRLDFGESCRCDAMEVSKKKEETVTIYKRQKIHYDDVTEKYGGESL